MCGLSLARQPLPRPLLFQATAIQHGTASEARKQAISAPALGRVAPVLVPGPSVPVAQLEPYSSALPLPPAPFSQTPETQETSLWPLVRMELTELLILSALNGLFSLLATALCRAPISRVYEELWPFLVPVHLGISWAFIMVPMALTGQTPMMAYQGLLLDTSQPERRLTFSGFHLLSVALFPLSFLCMVLTPDHRTLAELLSGQEILARPSQRLR